MGVEFDAVLEPGDVRTGYALGHAVEGQFPSQNVLGLEVGRVHHLGALRSSLVLPSCPSRFAFYAIHVPSCVG